MASDRLIVDLSVGEAEHLLLELAGASPLMDQFKAQLRDEITEKRAASRGSGNGDRTPTRGPVPLPPCST